MRKTTLFFVALFTLLAVTRLCHLHILWEGDAYPLAAAHAWRLGRALYRDLWFDKPPLLPILYLPLAAGWTLRMADALYALAACGVAYGFARRLWSEHEGLIAAGLMAFYLTFDLPSSVIPVASDLLMLVPHLAAVWMAAAKRPLLAGALAGVAFWINPKGLFVLAACAVWDPAGVVWMGAGFAAVSAVAVGALAGYGALGAYWDEVWRWGRLYAASPMAESPVRNALLRTGNWVGFHAAAVIAAGAFLKQSRSKAWWAWLGVTMVGVAAGMRFFPRYYFLLLPVAVLMAARGFVLLGRCRWYVALALLIPVIRFGPSYLTAARDSAWRDTAMDRDSRSAAALVRPFEHTGDALFVWGYRPELYIYTGLPAATRYLDSQPLSGVPADRHLSSSEPVETVESSRRRAAIPRARPAFVIDGLALYNPLLAITAYPELAAWLADYREVGRTAGCIVYQRR